MDAAISLLSHQIGIVYPDTNCEECRFDPGTFPSGDIIELDKAEWDGVKSKFSTSNRGGQEIKGYRPLYSPFINRVGSKCSVDSQYL